VRHPGQPAAYIRVRFPADPAARAIQQSAILDLADRNGWPEPAVYFDRDQPGYDSALAELTAAITAGRHDAVLLVGPGAIRGCPGHLLQDLLASCTRQGVSVDYLILGSGASGPGATGPGSGS